LGTANLQCAVGIGPIESTILLSWAKQKEKEELREEKERERENKKALNIASRKTIYVYHDGSASEFSIADQTELDRLLSIFSALQEVDLLHEPVNKKVILSWEQLQDSKLYLPLKSAVKVDVQTLQAVGLGKKQSGIFREEAYSRPLANAFHSRCGLRGLRSTASSRKRRYHGRCRYATVSRRSS
jgi:hypothetical protein